MRMIQSTKLSKAVFKLGGLIYKIKRPVRTYRWNPETCKLDKANYRWQWLGLHTGLLMSVDWARRLDKEHFEHWAYVHNDCGPVCEKCGGQYCEWDIAEEMANDDE